MSDLIRAAVSAFLHPGGPYLFVRIVTAAYAVSAIGRLIPVRRKQIAGYRPKQPRSVTLAAGAVAVAPAAAACAVTVGHGTATGHGTVTAGQSAITPGRDASPAVNAATSPGNLLLGVFEPGEWTSYQPVARFAVAIGQNPSLVLIYSGWPEPFQAHFAAMVHAHHAEPFVQMEPVGVSLQSIAAGRHDRYLKTYADQVRSYGYPVTLSFAAEMNGDWYAWGAGHTSPRVFVAAWRHMVDVFRAEHARNITWLWTVNSVNASKVPLRPRWARSPGRPRSRTCSTAPARPAWPGSSGSTRPSTTGSTTRTGAWRTTRPCSPLSGVRPCGPNDIIIPNGPGSPLQQAARDHHGDRPPRRPGPVPRLRQVRPATILVTHSN